MLTAKPQVNLAGAREYFREHLKVGDYYAQGRQVSGEWIGLGAERLGLQGQVKEPEFLALCEGLHPQGHERLTARLNSLRQEGGRSVPNRRVFYDFTLSPPKSVSVVGLYQDDRIVALHRQAVKTALQELESLAETRVRKLAQCNQRNTGNVVAATFQHDTSRSLDPHLHTHCVVFNATFDATEDRWKAIEVQGIYRAQRFIENLYYHELAKGLRSLGYAIENNPRDFEIKGVPASVIERFSKRHRQIDAEAENRIRRQGLIGDLQTLRRQVAVARRQRKQQDSVAARLRPRWSAELSAPEGEALGRLKDNPPLPASPDSLRAALAWAEQQVFERKSVVYDHELMSAALSRGRGEAFQAADLRHAVAEGPYLLHGDSNRLTSAALLRTELEIVLAARDGRHRFEALSPAYQPAASLHDEQRIAAEQILGSRDFITLFRGGAGTGKSHTLKEVVRGLELANRSVVVLAPQRQQVIDLQSEGMRAETLTRFLASGKLSRGAVVIVDEAGQVGGRQLRDLIGCVQSGSGRLILSGDTRQHGAVAASDALRAIEKHSGLKATELKKIRRQDPTRGRQKRERKLIRRYRAAVKAAAAGRSAEAFDRMDALGWIRELSPRLRVEALACEYLAAVARNEQTLVVAQTRAEVAAVNDSIRQKLSAAGKLGADHSIVRYRTLDLDEAQKGDPRFYRPGQPVFFVRQYGRFNAGERCEVVEANDRGVVLSKHGRRSLISFRYIDRIVLTASEAMDLASGDRLQLKFNGRTAEGVAISNGELVTVRKIRRNGGLVVVTDAGFQKVLGPDQRLFQRGYAVTSYGSQGKTVDTVLLSDGGGGAATDAKQWYVTISRGRRRAIVFTSDKTALREAAQRIGDRELALDLSLTVSSEGKFGPERKLTALTAVRSRLHAEVIARLGRQKTRIGHHV